MAVNTTVAGVAGFGVGVGGMFLAGRQLGVGSQDVNLPALGTASTLEAAGLIGGPIVGLLGLWRWHQGHHTALNAGMIGLGAGAFVGPLATLAGFTSAAV